MRARLLVGGILALVLALVLVLGANGASGKARVVDLTAEPSGDRILLSFRLENAFDESLRRRIDSGLPTGMSYELRLQRDRKRWFDKDLAKSELHVSAMYNAVTGEYLVNYKQNGDLVESRVVREPEALEAAMTAFEALPAFSLAGVRPSALERRLLVKVRAELGTKTVLFVIPTKIHTDWAESAKFRVDGGG